MTVFASPSQEFVYVRTYSRWIDEEIRRETWPETVERVISLMTKHRGDVVPAKVINKIRQRMLELSVLPSMRLVWAAGPAAEADNTTIYNCSLLALDSIDAFAECLYILMCGTGVGFSVEKKYTDKLPVVPELGAEGAGVFVVTDDKKGWADSVKVLMSNLYKGKDVDMDYSLIRPKGARLKTMGGRASGPAPLITLHNFIREIFQKAQGRKLTSLECHDIANQIADVVVVGGVRRSSQISLSDLDDLEMRQAKVWPFPMRRQMANNSAVYYEKPSAIQFLQEWSALAASGTGERGIFNLGGARKNAPKRRVAEMLWGTNPCAEIVLRLLSFCNLSEIVVREGDDLDELLDKVETATWIGVIQSSFTNFPYLRPEWKKNCDEERLLGVSITGQMDAPDLLTVDALRAMKARALKVAKRASTKMGLAMPAAITCVKPSGTVSQLVDSSSGMHLRKAKYFIRRYRISSTDPLFRCLRDQGVKFTPENGQTQEAWAKAAAGNKDACPIYRTGEEWSEDKVTTWVISFPKKSPDGAKVVDDMTAIEQLEWYKRIQTNWCEHNASMTVYVKDEEWFEVGNWVYKNWDLVNGLSFFPHDGGKYDQAPYETITKAEYEKLLADFPAIDYSKLSQYEMEDLTEGAKSYACVAGVCEI